MLSYNFIYQKNITLANQKKRVKKGANFHQVKYFFTAQGSHQINLNLSHDSKINPGAIRYKSQFIDDILSVRRRRVSALVHFSEPEVFVMWLFLRQVVL